jgi:tetratricopeptide (TPR) repeat protein
MGDAYNGLGKYQEAIDAYKEAIKIKPDFHEAYYNKGAAYGELKKYQEAINAYKETIKIKPNFHVAYHGIGVAYNKKAIDAKAYYNMGKTMRQHCAMLMQIMY